MRLNLKKMIQAMHRAIEEYEMIQNGDKIAVGVSGGKDSLALLACLNQYKKQTKVSFEIIAISIDLFGKTDFSKIENFCKELEVEYHIIRTNIQEVVFDIRKEKNPCSLCAKMRKGALCENAKKLGCNKVALGHHADDFMQTFFLSISKENRLSTLQPISYLSKTDIHIIRPFLYITENSIIEKTLNFPILQNECPANKKTEREYIKNILDDLDKKIPNFKKNLLASLTKTERYNLLNKTRKIFK